MPCHQQGSIMEAKLSSSFPSKHDLTFPVTQNIWVKICHKTLVLVPKILICAM